MSKKNFPAYEPLDDQLRMLKSDIRPDNALKTAVVGAQASTVIIPARVHVKQTAKAVLLYAVCVVLFLGAIMLLPKLFNSQSPISSLLGTPSDDRDTLTRSHLSEDEKALYLAAWDALKDTVPDDYTINDLVFDDVWLRCSDAFICSSYDWEQTKHLTIGLAGEPVTLYGYYFPTGSLFTVFANSTSYSLKQAYDLGILSETAIHEIYTLHRRHHINLYTQKPYDPPEPPVYPEDRDEVYQPERYTEQELRARKIVWNAIKNDVHKQYTINHLSIGSIYEFGDTIVCLYYGCPPPSAFFDDPDYEIILDYEIVFPSNAKWRAYANNRSYTLQGAYDAGLLTEENIRTVWKDHNDLPPEPDTPYLYNSSDLDKNLGELLSNKTCVNDHIVREYFNGYGFTVRDPEKEGVAKLFDGIKTQEDYAEAGEGKMYCTPSGHMYLYIDFDQPVKLSTYVFTTADQSNESSALLPVSWELYGCTSRREQDFVSLDMVYEGNLSNEDFTENGYVIDTENQGYYQWYTLRIDFGNAGKFDLQFAELEFYTD